MTLTEFLLARIAEDEAAATASQRDDRDWFDSAHQMRWTPARVLAECEAKRRIVELHPPRWAVLYSESDYLTASTLGRETTPTLGHSGPIYDIELRVLSLPYSDHPDYDEEWKP